ncbi:MAG: acyl carrier protein [Muribaculaceae bacterium]|nr:acyl carrier protein [Muribaculaceae bacterium]
MSNIEKYNNIFVEVFGVDPSLLNDDFSKDTVDLWDSVHQLNLVSLAEETFDIMLDPEDIMGFTSYGKGKEIVAAQGVDLEA